MRNTRKKKKNVTRIRRSGFVFRLYRQNIIHLWIVALVLTAGLVFMLVHNSGLNYLANYLFYRSTPNADSLTEFCSRDILDPDYVMEDIDKNGGAEQALNRAATSAFYKDNLYQEGGRYRFGITIDKSKLIDTGIYYDENYIAYTDVWDISEIKDIIPRENYCTEHLYFYEYDGMKLLMPISYDIEQSLEDGDKVRVTFAPIGVYSVYMVYDLYQAGYTEDYSNYMIDVRETPVDPEDEIFKDVVMYCPFPLAFLIAAILLTVVPSLHPTYRQLSKYGRTIPKAVERVDADYDEHGITAVEGKISYLDEWLVKKSFFKNGIEINYKKQQN